MDTQPHISRAPRQVRRLFSVVSLRSSYQFYCVALRSMSGFGGNISSPPSILSDTLSLPHSSEAASLTGEFTVDVNLTSCGAQNSAVTAALATDLGLDSLIGCSDRRSLSVFRRLTSWHIRFTVLVFRSLWSEVRTAASTIVEDIASFALTLSCTLCDQSVNATVAQSMQVVALSLSDTTTGGTTSDKRPQMPPQLGDAVTLHSQPSQRSSCRVLLN